MKIVVCVKQVPDTSDIKWTENNTMVREGVESILNPFDEYAVETAIRLKESAGSDVTITALTMGPPQAKEALKKCLAMGCDEAILVSDKKFAAADTWATGRTVAKAIETVVKDYDLIICGQFAIDGDTGQTGPSIADQLSIPQLTYIKEIESYNKDNNAVVVKREVEEGIQTLEMELPGLICMLKTDYEPRMPNIKGVMKANRAKIPMYSMEDLGLTVEEVGFKGSPTYVAKSFRKPPKTQGVIINEADPDTSVEKLIETLREKKILV